MRHDRDRHADGPAARDQTDEAGGPRDLRARGDRPTDVPGSPPIGDRERSHRRPHVMAERVAPLRLTRSGAARCSTLFAGSHMRMKRRWGRIKAGPHWRPRCASEEKDPVRIEVHSRRCKPNAQSRSRSRRVRPEWHRAHPSGTRRFRPGSCSECTSAFSLGNISGRGLFIGNNLIAGPPLLSCAAPSELEDRVHRQPCPSGVGVVGSTCEPG